MDQLAPDAVAVAARLGAPGKNSLGGHEGIVRTAPRRQVRVTPLDVENLAQGIGTRLTSGAIGTSDRGLLRQEVRHDPGL